MGKFWVQAHLARVDFVSVRYNCTQGNTAIDASITIDPSHVSAASVISTVRRQVKLVICSILIVFIFQSNNTAQCQVPIDEFQVSFQTNQTEQKVEWNGDIFIAVGENLTAVLEWQQGWPITFHIDWMGDGAIDENSDLNYTEETGKHFPVTSTFFTINCPCLL